MRPPEDDVLLRDMLDHARRAVAAVSGKERADLDSDFILAAALERFIEVIGEAASKISPTTQASATQIPWRGTRTKALRAIETLHGLPRLAIHTGLLQHELQQPETDVTTMWIRDCDNDGAARHELVLAARERSFKPESAQYSDEIPTFDGTPGRH